MAAHQRSNAEWLADLQGGGERQSAALEELRLLLLRASLLTFHRYLSDVSHKDPDQILQLAEDCAQDALLAILRQLPGFRGDSLFTTWAYKFAVNISLTTARRERYRGVSLEDLYPEENGDTDWLPAAPAGAANPAMAAMRQEASQAIRQVIQEELTDRQRQVLKLIVFDDIPMDIVVDRLETNRNAVYKLLHDARKRLKQALLTRGFGLEETLDLFSDGR